MLALHFNESTADHLDKYALLADQSYNHGNHDDWFGHFRGGYFGFLSRLSGVLIHFNDLYAWKIPPVDARLADYHVTSFFFHADSAIECFTYALNAFGNCVDPTAFVPVRNLHNLSKIRPSNICGSGSRGSGPLPGYARYFPKVQDLWNANIALIQRVADHHDISKHRRTIYSGGQLRSDAPPGYFESVGITDPALRTLLAPHETIFIKDDPKTMLSSKNTEPWRHGLTLERLASDYTIFINKTLDCALTDARANVPLKESAFRE